MEKQPHNIQDVFLNQLRREKLAVTVFLMSGVKLAGRIKSFDKYAVILESGQRDQLIFKHAISTVVTTRSAPDASTPASPPSKPPPPATDATKAEPSN